MNKVIGRFIADESGATAIDYGLIAGLITLAIIGTLSTISERLLDAPNPFGVGF
jgi:pilus assembly protein Flp/PilA